VRRVVVATMLLGACSNGAEPDDDPRSISPLDGQTGWPVDQPLVVVAEGMDIPPDYPLGDLIRVSDLDQGGFVPGQTERSSTFLTFTPDEPLDDDRRYGWVVDIPEPVPHGPELVFPPILEEPAVFSTGAAIDVLGGSVDGLDRPCVVLSRPVGPDDRDTWTITTDEDVVEDVVGFLLDRAEWTGGLDLPEGDPGVDVLCFEVGEADPDPTVPPVLEPGDRIRLTWGEQGPWLVELQDAAIRQVIDELRRSR
jgi:hypothetical protein